MSDVLTSSALRDIAEELQRANHQKHIENLIRLGELYKSMGSNASQFALAAKSLIDKY